MLFFVYLLALTVKGESDVQQVQLLLYFQSGTPQTRQTSVIHLLRSQRAALLFLELFTMNVLLQWVVI